MRNSRNKHIAAALVVAAAATAGCDDFLTVNNPTVIEASTVDPVNDATTFARSAQQDLTAAYGWQILYSGWLTHEIYVGDSFPTRNEFGLREVQRSNLTMRDELYSPIQLAIASGARVQRFLAGTATENSSPDVVRGAFVKGFASLLLAETFCAGVISGETAGSPITSQEAADTAIAQFSRVIDVAARVAVSAQGVVPVVTAADVTEARNLANAALVGRARAKLFRGDKAGAIADANAVPAGFTYSVNQADDPNSRTRLGNRLWQYTFQRESIVVAPALRALNDTLVRFDDAGRNAQDSELRFFRQRKFNEYAAPIRLASKLEAQYIAAEAGSTADQVTFINARRAALGQSPTFASTDAGEVTRELLGLKTRQFFLEGKRTGDGRRNVGNLPYLLPSGTTYYKAGQGNIGTQICVPLPLSETDNNPNFPKS